MIGKKVNSKQSVSLTEVKEILKERLDQNEKSVEPTYEQNLAKEYVKQFAKLTPAKEKKLLEELRKLDFLDEKTVIKICDIAPQDTDILNLILPREANADEAKQKEIIELVKKYLK